MPKTVLFPKNARVQRQNVLQDATIRDFSGGWNVVDSDLNLSTKFSKVLKNMQRGIDGANDIRYGTELFADISEHIDEIIGTEYYSGAIIAVGANGVVVKINADKSYSVIWNDDFANNLAGNPDGWSTNLTFCSFAQFNGKLIICNGINKPLIVDTALTVTYLNDPATGSNANTPIARFVKAVGRYLVMAGAFNAVDTLYISSTDTSGVWVGDPAPNDAVNVSLGSRVPTGSNTIKGVGSFRDKIIVAFEDAILPGTLGGFSGSDHVPIFDDSIENHGSLSHRVLQTLGEDILFCDTVGVSSVKRATFTSDVKSARYSYLIDPGLQSQIDLVSKNASLEDLTWSLYDSHDNNYMLFIPDHHTDITEYRCFVFKKNDALKILTWQDWRNWKFRCGCRSALKRIFLCREAQVYILGHTDNPVHKDYVGDQEMWDDDTVFTDNYGFTPVADVNNSGVSIPFDWELPWTDAGERFLVKSSKFINFDTEGDQRFTCQMFTDNIRLSRTDPGEKFLDDFLFDDGLGWDVDVYDPTLEIEFIGGSGPGYGNDEYGDYYGGGRPTRHEGLYAFPAHYKLSKLRMLGDGIKSLKFVSISMAYTMGSIRR